MAAHRLPRPWDSPGKNTGVGCHFLLQCMKVKSESEVAQSSPTLSDPMNCSIPGSSVHGIFQARVLEWGAIAFSSWSLYSLLHFFFIYFCSDFYDFLSSTNFGVCSSFSRCFFLGIRLGYLFNVSLIFWGRLVLLWTSLSTAFTEIHMFWVVEFSLSMFLCLFWFPFWFLQWSVGYSEACCLACICLCFFNSFFPVVDI